MHEYYAKNSPKLKQAMKSLLKPVAAELEKMSGMSFFVLILELVGTAVFDVLGALLGIKKDMDIFGVCKPIAVNQGLQWYFAEMGTRIEAARLLTLRAADARQKGEPCTKLAAMAKLYASETACFVCDLALQVHGGYGYMKDFAIERMYRDARILRIYEGTSEVQKMVISREVLSGR